MYDEPDDKYPHQSQPPIGTLTAIDPKRVTFARHRRAETRPPDGAAADGKGHMSSTNESKNTIQVIDVTKVEG